MIFKPLVLTSKRKLGRFTLHKLQTRERITNPSTKQTLGNSRMINPMATTTVVVMAGAEVAPDADEEADATDVVADAADVDEEVDVGGTVTHSTTDRPSTKKSTELM